ncbi:MAG: DUF6504 family protein [Bacillota bacterium]
MSSGSRLGYIRVAVAKRFEGMIPESFSWKGKQYRIVRIVEEWCDTGEWWKGETEKKFYRVETDWSMVEIFYDTGTKSWGIYRIYD